MNDSTLSRELQNEQKKQLGVVLLRALNESSALKTFLSGTHHRIFKNQQLAIAMKSARRYYTFEETSKTISFFNPTKMNKSLK